MPNKCIQNLQINQWLRMMKSEKQIKYKQEQFKTNKKIFSKPIWKKFLKILQFPQGHQKKCCQQYKSNNYLLPILPVIQLQI